MNVYGSPIYYKYFNSGGYVIAIVNVFLKFQFFDKETIIFLAIMSNKGKLLRKKNHKGINEDIIIKLALSRNYFGYNIFD